MDLPKGTKIRVAYCEDFPNGDPVYISVNSIASAKLFLEAHSFGNQYQSDQHPIPGLRNYAAIEYFDETDGEWTFYNE